MSPQAAAEEEVILETAIKKEYLAKTLDILRTLRPEARFKFGREGLTVALVGPGNVASHFLELDAGAFDDVPDGEVMIGINLDRVADAIDKADASDVITLGYLAEKRMLNVSYGNVDVNIGGIDPDSIRNPPDEADIDFINTFTVERQTFADALDIVDMVTDHIIIECYPDDRRIDIFGEGDIDDATYQLGREDVVAADIDEETRSMYSVDYLWAKGNETGGIVRAIPDTEITIRQANEFPMDLEYSYADGHGEVLTQLAPRIESG